METWKMAALADITTFLIIAVIFVLLGAALGYHYGERSKVLERIESRKPIVIEDKVFLCDMADF